MHASRQAVPVAMEEGGYEGRMAEWGEYTVNFERIPGESDFSPYFVGLPDDSCQCPHWGYVFKGKLRFTYRDREEVISAGEAYYAPPGHRFACLEDAETVEFSPTAALRRTLEVVEKNAAAMAGASS